MELADLKVKMDVVMVSKNYIQDNMNRVDKGYIDRNNGKFFSDDMVEKLAGKKVRISEIDHDDQILSCLISGFWCSHTWIDKVYVAPEKPKVVKPKPTGTTKVPTKAEDGTTFGTVFKKLLKKHPELGVLSTNRLSNLRLDELEDICAAIGVEYNDADVAQLCRTIFDTIIND